MKKYNCPDCQMIDNDMSRYINFCSFCKKVTGWNFTFVGVQELNKPAVDYGNPCNACLNHPKNGGSGICNCSLGGPKVVC